MAGDFNSVEDAIDRLPMSDIPDPSVPALDDLKLSLGLMLADGWRVTNPTQREYTFHRGTGRDAVFSRLDRMYVTSETFELAREWSVVKAGVRTDHSLIKVQLTSKNAPVVGPGRPIFPLQLLRDKKLSKAIKTRGIEAIRQLDSLLAEGVRTERLNPKRILSEFKLDAMEMARDRERDIVPKLLADIRAREQELKKVKAGRDHQEADKLAEVEALQADTTATNAKV